MSQVETLLKLIALQNREARLYRQLKEHPSPYLVSEIQNTEVVIRPLESLLMGDASSVARKA